MNSVTLSTKTVSRCEHDGTLPTSAAFGIGLSSSAWCASESRLKGNVHPKNVTLGCSLQNNMKNENGCSRCNYLTSFGVIKEYLQRDKKKEPVRGLAIALEL